MKTRLKQEEEIKPLKEDYTETRLDFLKGLSAIGSRLNRRISSDWVMARLEEKDREAIREMMANAYYGDNLLKEIPLKFKRWKFDVERQVWEDEYMSKEEKDAIVNQADKMFDTFTIRVETTVILNRNVKNNWLVRLMAGAQEEEVEYDKSTDEKKIAEKVTDMMKKEK